MDTTLWTKVHGATTHFPLALALGSGALDAAGFVLAGRPVARELHAAGYWMMLLGALGSGPAVFSGLSMTKGSVLGHGALRMHHLFVWPAFALLVALATWRVLEGRRTRLQERLDRVQSQLAMTQKEVDRYAAERQRHGVESVEREVEWLSELINAERNGTPHQKSPTTAPTAPTSRPPATPAADQKL